MTIPERLDQLLAVYTSYRRLEGVLGIDGAYLYRLHMGEKINPSDDVLKKLGLRRVVTYETL